MPNLSDELSSEECSPYGVRVSFEVPDSSKSFGGQPFEGELSGGSFCILTEHNVRIKVEPFGDTLFDVYLEPFESRQDAEGFGDMFVNALLWGALSGPSVLVKEPTEHSDTDIPHYSKGPLLIYDMRHEEVEKLIKRSYTIDATLLTPLKGQTFFVAVSEFLSREEQLSERVKTSLEIYASASHEKTARAQFVSMVSALEPLVRPERYTSLDAYAGHRSAVEDTLGDLLDVIRRAERKENGPPDPLLDSWRNRIKDSLRSESIGQALRRMVSERLPDVDGAPEVISAAYNLRSRILHDGATIEEDDRETIAMAKRLIPMVISSFISREAYSDARRRRKSEGIPSV